jgi:Family of unknown function (DUF6876)
MTKTRDPNILSQFTGSEHWYRHGRVPSITFSDGAKHVADTAGPYWLLDEIALTQRYAQAVAVGEFQVWKLTVNADSSARLVCEDGNCKTVYTKAIPFTDFPAEGITLWFADDVIYCPANTEQLGEPAPLRLPFPPLKPEPEIPLVLFGCARNPTALRRERAWQAEVRPIEGAAVAPFRCRQSVALKRARGWPLSYAASAAG